MVCCQPAAWSETPRHGVSIFHSGGRQDLHYDDIRCDAESQTSLAATLVRSFDVLVGDLTAEAVPVFEEPSSSTPRLR